MVLSEYEIESTSDKNMIPSPLGWHSELVLIIVA